MATDDQPDSRTPADGAAPQNPAPAHGSLLKAGLAAAVFAAAALAFAGEQPSPQKSNTSGLKAGDTKTFTLPGGVEMEMVYVAPGSFMMGSPESEEGREEDETQHRVTLTKGFWLGKYPVTQRQWKELVRANGVSFSEGEPVPYFSRDGKGCDLVRGIDTSDFPMERISWYDCKTLVNALNKNERGELHWSFPTEAQWEFAARGGTKSRGYTYSGGNDMDKLGWYYENSGLRRLSDSDRKTENVYSNKCRTHSVREKDVGNELGIVGMSGNVCEWCADWYGEYPRESVSDPIGPASGWIRVLRGGSYYCVARDCRSADRGGFCPGDRCFSSFGFRLCCSAGPRGEAEPGGRVTETPPTRSGRRPARAGVHGKVQLWEDGPYWAETNIGAEDPEDYGYYFWWGDTVGYKREGDAWVASDGSSRNFEFAEKNTPTYGKNIDKLKSEGWVTEDGVLAPKHDAAHVHWGGDWRMPTKRELRALEERCDWTWTTKNGIEGCIVRGKGKCASASIFLPCAAYGYGPSLGLAGSYGYYWSSVPYSGCYCSWYLRFDSDSPDPSYWDGRNRGFPVRPVQGVGCCPTRAESGSNTGDSTVERVRRKKGETSGLKAGDTKTFTLPGGVEMEMVYVEPGSFTMGSPESKEGQEEDDTQYRVTLTRGFWLGKYPVTQSQWKMLVRANGVSFAKGEPTPYFSRDGEGRDVVSGMDTSDFPMENISWDDCKVLVDTLNKNERREWHWSFPTEAQWEFAARGGTKSRGYTYSGGNDLDALGWYYENSGLRRLSDSDWETENVYSNKCRTHSVREKDAGNELGIVGMSGNVWELCADWNGEYLRGSVSDPTGPVSGRHRVLRGGGWNSCARFCRSANRSWFRPGFRLNFCGFRLCCSAGPRGGAEPEGRVTETPPTRSGRRPARVGTHGKVQLWEDGPYWAETNIGAENPEDYGYYFWWGDTVGYKCEGDAWVASDGSSRNFSFDTEITPTYGKRIGELKIQGWITKDGVLAPEHDAAHVHWGGDWRMPTEQELQDLVEKCDWIWTAKNGIEGYVVQGRGGYASASIFLPCAGYGEGTSLDRAGSYGYYWSSVLGSDDYYSLYLCFYSISHYTGSYDRYRGRSVRPVQGFTK